jgi:hypothetical protein
MMFRCGWGTKENQEVTLAVWLQRPAFDSILREAVHSTFVREVYGSKVRWKQTLAQSAVRLQWDPDHDPAGGKMERRAIQLGLRGDVLARYAREWIVRIEDISDFVSQQRLHSQHPYNNLVIPREDVYPVSDVDIARRLGVSTAGTAGEGT